MDLSSEGDVGNALQRVVMGEVESVQMLKPIHISTLHKGARLVEPLTLTPEGVAKVLRGLLTGSIAPGEAQSWASFMRNGYFSGPDDGPILPLDIEYQPSADEAIADAISRLDEIGDLIDGDVSTEELLELLASLNPKTN